MAADGDGCYPAPPWKSVPCESVPASWRAVWTFSGGIFDIDGKKRTIAELDARAGEPDFWNDSDKAQGVLKEQARLKAAVDGFDAQMRPSRTPAS